MNERVGMLLRSLLADERRDQREDEGDREQQRHGDNDGRGRQTHEIAQQHSRLHVPLINYGAPMTGYFCRRSDVAHWSAMTAVTLGVDSLRSTAGEHAGRRCTGVARQHISHAFIAGRKHPKRA